MMIASIWLQQGHHLTPLESGMMTLGYLVTVTGDDPGRRDKLHRAGGPAADDSRSGVDRLSPSR